VAYASVTSRSALRNTAFCVIFITLMLPVRCEHYLLPTKSALRPQFARPRYSGLTLPLVASPPRDIAVSPVSSDPFRIELVSLPHRRRRPFRFFWNRTLLPRLSRTNMAALIRDPVHLRLEPVPPASGRAITTRHMQTIVIGIKDDRHLPTSPDRMQLLRRPRCRDAAGCVRLIMRQKLSGAAVCLWRRRK